MKKIKYKTVLDFGKYRGKTVKDVLRFDPQYIYWLSRETDYILSDKIESMLDEWTGAMYDGLTYWDIVD